MKCSVSPLGLGCFSLCPRKTIYFLFFPFAQLRLAALHVAFHCHFLLLLLYPHQMAPTVAKN